MAVGMFEYVANGKWFATGTGGDPTLFDIDTNHGMRIDFTLTGVDTFDLMMTPLNNPAIAYSKSGTLDGPAGRLINWVEFELFNTDSDYYPAHDHGRRNRLLHQQYVDHPDTRACFNGASGFRRRPFAVSRPSKAGSVNSSGSNCANAYFAQIC